jgi:predicted nucleotidyltransferase
LSARDPNLDRVELVAAALAPLLDRLVFVGGCAAGLLMRDPGATPIRLTLDVDLVSHVTALAHYHDLEAEFLRLGFRRDKTADAPICRWIYRGIQVDLMPTDPTVLGFANRWYELAVQTATSLSLPSGTIIRLISAPAFLGTKFEAFADRGQGDLLASHDLEDIVNVVASRARIVEEVLAGPQELRDYLAARCRQLVDHPDLEGYLPGLLLGNSDLELTDMVIARLRAIC